MSKNTNGSVTESKLSQYGQALAGRIRNSQSDAQIQYNEYNDCVCAQKDAKEVYDYFVDGYEEFVSVKGKIVPISKEVEGLYLDIVDDYEKKLKTLIDEKTTTAIKSIKEIGVKTKKLHEAWCKTETECNDNCNSEELDKLREFISGKCDRPGEDLPSDQGLSDFDNWKLVLKTDVKDTVACFNDFENKMVKTFSVSALVNLDRLKDAIGKLKDSMKNLRDNICDNMEFKKAKVKESFEELIAAIECQSAEKMDERGANLTVQGLYKMCHFLDTCTPDKTWEEIKAEIDKCLCINVTPEDC